MTCPHCRKAFHAQVEELILGTDADGAWILNKVSCPACKKFITRIIHDEYNKAIGTAFWAGQSL